VSKKHYDWERRAEIDEHSLTKHSVLVEYLLAYFSQRMLNRRGAERFRITLVDGFCGGGMYRLRGTNTEVVGSPLRMLKAVEEASLLVNKGRTKRVELDVQFLFVDKDRRAIDLLTAELKQRGYGAQIDKSIHLVCSEFVDAADSALALVRRHTPRASTAIFFLDQYGYTDVPSTLVRRIFSELPNSEVVLTFHVSSFATYTNDELADRIAETLQVDIRQALNGRTIDDLKQNDADWRRFIQGALYQALVTGCGARYFTPFFIRGVGSGHGEYWLVHLSQHYRAQDVMKQVHWAHHNHFIHYGGAGLDMLAPQTMGFMQKFDGGFRFDDVARHQSDAALREQLGNVVLTQSGPKRLGDIYSSTCNGSPATAYMYKVALESLASEGDIVITSSEGTRRRLARYMADGDLVEANRQARFRFP
jgi:three-Cys-motif partner protein